MKTTEEQGMIAEALERLFRTYPPSAQGETPAATARNRIERAKVYLEAIEIYEVRDIEAAVRSFLSGSAPGHNPAFAPSAPQLGAETRRCLNLRLDSEYREKMARPRLAPPEIVHTAESRAKVAEMVKGVVERAAAALQSEADTKRKAEGWAKVNARFEPDHDPDAMRKRLGFSVGDPVGDADAA